jgi:hypothetical protein
MMIASSNAALLFLCNSNAYAHAGFMKWNDALNEEKRGLFMHLVMLHGP